MPESEVSSHTSHHNYPVSDTFGEIVARSQALTVDVVGKGFGAAMTRQQIIADRKFDELDVEQSMANRYSMTGEPSSK